jgi:hypothetical protein
LESDGIQVTTTFGNRVLDVLNQRVRNSLVLEVRDHGKRLTLREQWDIDIIFAREFRAMVENSRALEFVGWFERYRGRKLTRAKSDSITLLRRR